ncbi:MAG: ferrous iron transport protein A [Lachnospiraceae bacterium]|nr:ferrous iron transport protein A [Lachnospiraceae bacterium]
MTILDGKVNQTYTVTDVSIEETIMRRLEALGINSGTKLRMMNRKKNGTLIIKVRGTRWAVGRDIARGILVNPEGEEAPDGNN